MRIVVITCEAYKDAWGPFTALFRKFWPHCPHVLEFRSDRDGMNWCSVALRCAKEIQEPILMMQEDFFLCAPVRSILIDHALSLMEEQSAGMIRLYPSPGGSRDIGDRWFASVPVGTRYRISCQASIWRPEYLAAVAAGSMGTTGEAGDFENLGTLHSDTLPETVLALKRSADSYPLDYISSAITRGRWNPAAIDLCKRYGIFLDRSMRAVDVA